MTVYLQMGYGKGDKVETAINNNSIGGIVLSPRDEKKDSLESFTKNFISQNKNIDILFDPQLYYSTYTNADYKYLANYEYFPGIINQSYFRFKNIHDTIEKCLSYQKSIGLKKLISPNILINSFSSREAQTVLNFADETAQIAKSYSEPILVTLIINESAFNELSNLNSYLNELTTIDIDGYYIIVVRNQTQYNQYFDSSETIKNIMYTVYSLSTINGYEIIMGYTDIIGVLFKPFGVKGIATGWYNGSRKFTVQQRILPSSGGRLSRERYTSNKLLNSLLISELDAIQEQFGINSREFKSILSNTKYDHLLMQGNKPSSNWNRNISYLHHWCALHDLYSEFDNAKSISEKLDLLQKKITNANNIYKKLIGNFIHFDSSSSNRHLTQWEEAIKLFRNDHKL